MESKSKLKKWVILLGIATLDSVSIYVIYRLVVLFLSLGAETQLLGRTIIILFFLAESFILLNGFFYFLGILIASKNYVCPHGPDDIKKWPTVTVFLPMRNEPLEILSKTFTAVGELDYPNYKIVVVDSSDSKDHQKAVKKLSEGCGIEYFQTPYPRHGAKAGAINEAMKVYKKAKYYAFFDADYRPIKSFLKEIVPILEVEKTTGFVQTPQFYSNVHESLVSRTAQIQQSVFYEYICEAKSVHKSTFLCGTNMVIRRQALEEIGGWDERSITEDFATSIKLVAHGWPGLFYNHLLAFGDGPISLRQFFKQQYRWSRGTFEAFFMNLGLIFSPKSKFTFWTRLEFTLSGTFFIVGFVTLFLIMVPVLYIFFNISAYQTDPLLFSIAYLPYLVMSFTFFGMTMHRRHIKVRDLLRAQSLMFLTMQQYIKAFVDTFTRRESTFETVSKVTTEFDTPRSEMYLPIALFYINVTATFYGLWTIPFAANKVAVALNLVWTTFHSVLLIYFMLELYVKETEDISITTT